MASQRPGDGEQGGGGVVGGDDRDSSGGDWTSPNGSGQPAERRRHRRFRLGVSVNLHIGGRPNPIIVEIVDIGARGARFRARPAPLHIEEEAAFGFVSRDQHICVANGRVLRISGEGDFVLSVDRANAAFHSFLESLAA